MTPGARRTLLIEASAIIAGPAGGGSLRVHGNAKAMLHAIAACGYGITIVSELPGPALERALAEEEVAGLVDRIVQAPKLELAAARESPGQLLLTADARVAGMALEAGLRPVVLDPGDPDDLASCITSVGAMGGDGRAEAPRHVIPTVGGLIQHVGTGKVLLVLTWKWKGGYGLPGGKIHYGETMEQAYVREIREETGLLVTDNRLVLVQDSVESPEFWAPRHFLLINYVSRTASDELVLNHEILRADWVDPQEALGMRLNTPTRKLLESAMEQKLLLERGEG